MKRLPEMSDEDWNAALVRRKEIAERRMAKSDAMFTLSQIASASIKWYGKTDADSQCLAENRLMRGEVPK